MKASSLVSLICCLTINGVNSLHQPAVARDLPQPTHIAEALSSANQSGDATDKYEVFQEGDKYGYADDEDYEVIAAKFDRAYEFFDGLTGVRMDSKWGFIDRDGNTVIALRNDNNAWVRVGKQVGYINETGKFIQ